MIQRLRNKFPEEKAKKRDPTPRTTASNHLIGIPPTHGTPPWPLALPLEVLEAVGGSVDFPVTTPSHPEGSPCLI